MKTKISTRWHRLLLGAIPALLLGSCIADKDFGSDLRTGDQTTVTFSIQLPAAATPSSASRALNEATDENDVSEIDILVFAPNGGNFVYNTGCRGSAITGNGQTRTFTVTLRQGAYDLVMLANSRSEVNAAAANFTGRNKADVLAMLETQMPLGGKWIATATDLAYRPFPMWGDVGNVTINDQTDLTGAKAIKLTRMVARVDVAVAVENFKLTSVDVYNYNTKGAIVPATGAWDITNGKAAVPSVPASPPLTTGPIVYDNENNKTEIDETNNRCYTEIYLFEAENHISPGHTTAKNLTDRTCLVIGGVWDADGDSDFSNDGQPTYYRVDFSRGTGTQQTFLDVLRNHKYSFSINKVSGPGYEDSQTAFESGPVNIEASVLQWDDGGMTEIVFDGQNYLSVSQSEFNFSRDKIDAEREDNVLYVETDYKSATQDGWYVEKTVDAADGTTSVSWVTLAPDRGAADNKTKVVLAVTENDTPQPRSAIIWIAAGRMRYPVTVTQSSAPALGVQLTDGSDKPVTELVFANKAPISPQILNVNWQPKDADLTITNTPVGAVAFPTGAISPALGNISNGNGGTGFQKYTITPSAFLDTEIASNPFLEKVSKIDFTTTNGIGYAAASVFLRQVNYALVPVGVSDCLLDGKQHSFGIRCNTAWQIASVTEIPSDGSSPLLSYGHTGDNLIVDQTGGYNVSTNGDMIKFTVVNDIDKTLSGTIKVTFTSPTGLFADFTVTIEVLNDPWARSNIVWDNAAQKLTFAVTRTDNNKIPANSQGVFFKWGSLVAISPVGATYSTSSILYSPTGTYNYAYTGSYAYTGIPYFDPTTFKDGIWGNDNPEEDDFENYDGISNTSGPGYDASDRGDICRYISDQPGWVDGSWRLPTGAEIQALIGESVEWNGSSWSLVNAGVVPAGGTGGNNAYGFFQLVSGYYAGTSVSQTNPANPTNGISVPASGYRSNTNGAAGFAGSYGCFWSGSSDSAARGCYLGVNSGSASQNSANRECGFPVRCIRDTGK